MSNTDKQVDTLSDEIKQQISYAEIRRLAKESYEKHCIMKSSPIVWTIWKIAYYFGYTERPVPPTNQPNTPSEEEIEKMAEEYADNLYIKDGEHILEIHEGLAFKNCRYNFISGYKAALKQK